MDGSKFRLSMEGEDNLSGTIKNVQKSLQGLEQTATSTGNKFADKFEKIQNSTAPLQRRLRDLQKLMAEMNFQGLSNTEQFTEIAQYAGNIKDSIADAGAAVKAFSSDTAGLAAATSAVQGIAGGFTALTGAMSLFGVENENVAQAIQKVQAAQAILNGVQAIANTLNKDSALMLLLKSTALKTNTASTTANTVAETANTAATAANTAADTTNTVAETANTAADAANTAANTANATAKGAATAATTAQTAATNAATTAQIANNAAVMANPYVLAAMAIAALVAGIAVWVSSMDEATEEQVALSAAVESFNEAVDGEMKKLADQITLYKELQKQYVESGKKVDTFAQKLINNTSVQKKLGVVVKTVDDVHRLFANKTPQYIKASNARANAMAAEAAKASALGEVIAQLSKVYNKLLAGEEVDWRDMRKIVESAGYTKEAADKLMRDAGLVYDISDVYDHLGYGNVTLSGDASLAKLIEGIASGGKFKVLNDLQEAFQKTFREIDEVDFGGLLTDNFNVLDDVEPKFNKASSAANKTGRTIQDKAEKVKAIISQTDDELKKVLTSFAGCNKLIQQADKEMKELDNTSEKYAENMERLKKVKFTAQVAKLALIDYNTIEGLNEARKIIEDIKRELPKGSDELEKWNAQLLEIDKKMYEFADAAAKNGDLKSMKSAQSTIDNIINTLPEGSGELEKWVKLWRVLKENIDDASQRINDLKSGIEQGSITALNRYLKKLQDEFNNKNLDIKSRIVLAESINELQKDINRKTKGEVTIEAQVNPFIVKGSIDDMRQSFKNAQGIISQLVEDYQNGISPKREVLDDIEEVNDALRKMGVDPIEIDIKTNFEEWVDKAKDAMGQLDTLIGTVDSITSLTEAIDEGKNSWEIFKSAVSAVESVLETTATVMEIVNAVKAVYNQLNAQSAATATEEGIALGVAAGAEEAKSATDTEQAATSIAATAALKAQEAAYLDMAAAAIYAAHASIPFAGVGIASGLVTAMMAAMTAQHAASAALAAFAEGGIVGGASYSGDKLIARVNSGEMILNNRQQRNLFNAIDGNRLGFASGEPSISFKIKGSDLYGTLKNYSNIKAKSGKYTGIR